MPIKTFELESAIRVLQHQMEEHAEANNGDITDFPLLQHLEDLLALQKSREGSEHTLCNLACMALEYEGEAEAVAAEAARISARAADIRKKAQGIRAFIEGRIQPGERIKDDRVTLFTRKSTVCEVTAEAADLPLEYQRVSVLADKVAIKKKLEAGEEITGATLITKYHLQIK